MCIRDSQRCGAKTGMFDSGLNDINVRIPGDWMTWHPLSVSAVLMSATMSALFLSRDKKSSFFAWKLIVQSQYQEDISELGKDLMVDLFGSKSKDTLSSLCHINFTKKVASAKAFVSPERLPQLPLQPHSIAYGYTIKLWRGLAWQMTWTLQIGDGRRKATSWFQS